MCFRCPEMFLFSSYSFFFFNRLFFILLFPDLLWCLAGLFRHFPVPAVLTLDVIMMNSAILHSIIHLRMVFY